MVKTYDVSESNRTKEQILTGSFFLFFSHIQGASSPVPNTHALTQGAQLTVILLVLPDVQERFAILKFQVVVFSQAIQVSAGE